MQTEEIINNFYKDRYSFILECANNILKLIKRQDLKELLVSDSFLYIYNNKEKLNDKIQNGSIESIAVNYMNQAVRWKNTPFKKTWVYKQTLEYKDRIDYNIVDDNNDNYEYELELLDKMNHIEIKKQELSIDKQQLYNYVFKDGINNSRKLSEYTGLARTTCFYLIRDLKNELKNGYKSNNNL